jgi:hypothetical protein
MRVIPVNQVVDKKKIIGKRGLRKRTWGRLPPPRKNEKKVFIIIRTVPG